MSAPTYQSPDALWACEFEDDPALHSCAPWFLFDLGVENGALFWSFQGVAYDLVDGHRPLADYGADGFLPGFLDPLELRSFEWTRRVVRDALTDVVRSHRPYLYGRPFVLDDVEARRGALSDAFCLKLSLFSCGTSIPAEWDLDLCVFRTVAESAFGPSLRDVAAHVPEWRGYVDVFPQPSCTAGDCCPILT